MVKQEVFGTVAGMTLIRSWSDENMMIRQDGTDEIYAEAIDPDFMDRSYTETDIPIEQDVWEDPAEGDVPSEVTEPPEEWPDPDEWKGNLEELGVPEELIEEEVEGDAEPEDPDGPVSVPEELV